MEVPTTGPYHIEPQLTGPPIDTRGEYDHIEDAEETLQRLNQAYPQYAGLGRIVGADGKLVPQVSPRSHEALRHWLRVRLAGRAQPYYRLPYMEEPLRVDAVCDQSTTVVYTVQEFREHQLRFYGRLLPFAVDQFGHLLCWDTSGEQISPRSMREIVTGDGLRDSAPAG
jgi:hypothetical protein